MNKSSILGGFLSLGMLIGGAQAQEQDNNHTITVDKGCYLSFRGEFQGKIENILLCDFSITNPRIEGKVKKSGMYESRIRGDDAGFLKQSIEEEGQKSFVIEDQHTGEKLEVYELDNNTFLARDQKGDFILNQGNYYVFDTHKNNRECEIPDGNTSSKWVTCYGKSIPKYYQDKIIECNDPYVFKNDYSISFRNDDTQEEIDTIRKKISYIRCKIGGLPVKS